MIEVDSQNSAKLMQDVVLPFDKLLSQDKRLRNIFFENDAKSKLLMAIAKISILILNEQIDEIETFFIKASLKHSNIKVEKELFLEYLFIYFDLLDDWMQENFLEKYLTFNGYMLKLKDIFTKAHENLHEDKSDDFFIFDSEERDQEIEHMHYERSVQVDAKTFIQNGNLKQDIIENIESLAHKPLHVTFESIDEIALHWRYFSTLFQESGEFKDLAYSLNILIHKISSLDQSAISQKEQEFCLVFIDAVHSDLLHWAKEVVIEQNARDVHYLDASFLANIAQFDLSLDALQNPQDDDDDELELF